MGLILRNQWESYMDCSDNEWYPDFELIGEGFTELSESKQTKTYVRKYHEDKTEQTDVIGYAPAMSYSCDVITDNPVISKIVSVTDEELIGDEAKVDIVTVNLFGHITDDVCVAYKRKFSIVPGEKGSGNGALIYTGTMYASGDVIKGTFSRSTRTFEPNYYS